jgi:hypothetical protein
LDEKPVRVFCFSLIKDAECGVQEHSSNVNERLWVVVRKQYRTTSQKQAIIWRIC